MTRYFCWVVLCLWVYTSAAFGETKLGKEALQKVKAGKGSLTAAEVQKVLGAPYAVQKPGSSGADFHMIWEEAARIQVVLDAEKDKALSFSGSFSDQVSSKVVTVENLLKLRVGMTEKEVTDVLGGPTEGEVERGTRNCILVWERSRRVTVSFKDGRVRGVISGDSTGK
jgi:hypothetical protein